VRESTKDSHLNKLLPDLGRRTLVMGILNVTPDSFSDGGNYSCLEGALRQADKLVAEGADILDIGGESSRPGAESVSVSEEQDRTIPVINEIKKKHPTIVISIDTSKSEVAEAALSAGAGIINDITALAGDEKMAALAAGRKAPVILMHMQGTPRTMQKAPGYEDIIGDIISFLKERVSTAMEKGIPGTNILVDPGIGFGKTLAHNLEIMRKLEEFHILDCPLVIGTSRKSFIGAVLDRPVNERLEGTLATLAVAAWQGADIVRVHDAAEAAQVVRMVDAIKKGAEPGN
jgi:dihydropteroate synthase